jgi:hypothetical protein
MYPICYVVKEHSLLWHLHAVQYGHSYTCIEAGHLGEAKKSTLVKHIAVRLYSGRAIQIEVAAIKKKGFK